MFNLYGLEPLSSNLICLLAFLSLDLHYGTVRYAGAVHLEHLSSALLAGGESFGYITTNRYLRTRAS